MPDQAVLPADVGLCGCNARNSLRATRCHGCGVTLPWVKVTPEPKQKVAKAHNAAGNDSPKVSVKVDSEALATFGIGLVIFVVSFLFPFMGLWMYRYFSSDESPLAGYAATGGFLGLGCWIWLGMDNAVNKGPESGNLAP